LKKNTSDSRNVRMNSAAHKLRMSSTSGTQQYQGLSSSFMSESQNMRLSSEKQLRRKSKFNYLILSARSKPAVVNQR